MLKAAIAHQGTVMLDVISPCVTFNDHEGSTKSYKFLQDHDEPINEVGFVPALDDIEVDYDSVRSTTWKCTTARNFALRKLLETTTPPIKPTRCVRLWRRRKKTKVLTGVFYINTQKPTFIDQLNMVENLWPRCQSR